MLDEETRYKILKILHQDPEISQRGLASHLGISLGKVNFCINALIDRGLVKAKNFRNNPNKRVYAYLLTPKGVEEKSKVAVRFLKRKISEYENLEKEIDILRREVEESLTEALREAE